MEAERPDPDALLRSVAAEAQKAKRGKLKVFFGASAGVGKTFAMLSAARLEREQGRVVAIGIVETHGRVDTEAMTRGFQRIALRNIEHRGTTLPEFDLDAALAFGEANRGALLLVDEFAHSNAPGSRHPKRWQDVQELLDAGIDVWTTLNVQHLLSLNDIVGGITGVRVNETVPDAVFDAADEVVVVDITPDELLRRLNQGKVYREAQAARAATNFFRKGNLLALRELALRRTADRVDEEASAFRSGQHSASAAAHRESILACIGPVETAAKVIQTTARLANQLNCDWHVLHVATVNSHSFSKNTKNSIEPQLKSALSEGAVTAIIDSPDVADAIVRYARQHRLTKVVLGRSRRTTFFRRDLAERIALAAPELDVVQTAVPHVNAAHRLEERAPRFREVRWGAAQWRALAAAAAICGGVALIATPLHRFVDLSSVMLIFLLAVVASAAWFGRVAAVAASVFAVVLFNFLFVPPRFSLSVADEQFYVTFAAMLAVGLVIGALTSRFKMQAHAASLRERRIRGVYLMSRELGAALLPEQVAEIVAKFSTSELGSEATIFLREDDDRLRWLGHAASAPDIAVAQWCLDHEKEAGVGTDTLSAGAHLMLPLRASMRVRGVLAVALDKSQTLNPEVKRWLEACATLAGVTLERIHYVDVARSSALKIESERLRNSLLTAISHDLRTPLTATLGLADTLLLRASAMNEGERDMIGAIRASVVRMTSLVNGLLEMARLDAGAVQMKREWQPIEEWVGSAIAASETLLAPRSLHVDLANDVPPLNVDAVLMERVMANLLENAAKYTPPSARIQIVARALGDAPTDWITIAVIDNGAGLRIGDEERLFERFERGRSEDATVGLGLGLAICRSIITAHGGRITADNVATGGARFTLYLPRGELPPEIQEVLHHSERA